MGNSYFLLSNYNKGGKLFRYLTNKELEVCECFLATKGQRSYIKDITNKMFITEKTFKTHLANIYLKLLIGTKTELMYLLLTNKKALEERKELGHERDRWQIRVHKKTS